MTAQQRELVHQILRDAPFDLGGDVAVHRPLLEQMLTAQPLPDDVRMMPGSNSAVSPVIDIDIAGVEPWGTLFHLHGGGFALGSARGSVGLVSTLARKTGMRAVSVEYRLAPEAPFPAALDDVTDRLPGTAGAAGRRRSGGRVGRVRGRQPRGRAPRRRSQRPASRCRRLPCCCRP